jgi:hypothetical protein
LDNLVSRAQAAVPRAPRESTPVSPTVVVAALAPAPDSGATIGGLSADAQAERAGGVFLAVATTSSLIGAPGAGEPPATGVNAPPSAPALDQTDYLSATPAAVPAPPPSPAPVAAPPAFAARIAEGRTDIGADGLYATRQGEIIRVHFDTELGRTRRPAKFEQIVRATLPAVFGPTADSLLRNVPSGEIATGGDLLVDLPQRGISLRHPDGRSLTVWPETRPGRDGPIIVAYRVATTP